MKLILKSDNESSIAKIVALAKSLNVVVEMSGESKNNLKGNNELKNRILSFKGAEQSSFGDASEWQRETRKDRDLQLPE